MTARAAKSRRRIALLLALPTALVLTLVIAFVVVPELRTRLAIRALTSQDVAARDAAARRLAERGELRALPALFDILRTIASPYTAYYMPPNASEQEDLDELPDDDSALGPAWTAIEEALEKLLVGSALEQHEEDIAALLSESNVRTRHWALLQIAKLETRDERTLIELFKVLEQNGISDDLPYESGELLTGILLAEGRRAAPLLIERLELDFDSFGAIFESHTPFQTLIERLGPNSKVARTPLERRIGRFMATLSEDERAELQVRRFGISDRRALLAKVSDESTAELVLPACDEIHSLLRSLDRDALARELPRHESEADEIIFDDEGSSPGDDSSGGSAGARESADAEPPALDFPNVEIAERIDGLLWLLAQYASPGVPELEAVLLELAEAEVPSLQSAIAECALELLENPRSIVEVLSRGLDARAPDATSIQGIARHVSESEALLPKLVALLSHEHSWTREPAARTLHRFSAKARPLVEQRIVHASSLALDERARLAHGLALYAPRDPRAAELVIEALRTSDGVVFDALLEIVALLGPLATPVVPDLESWLGHENQRVGTLAARALFAMRPRDSNAFEMLAAEGQVASIVDDWWGNEVFTSARIASASPLSTLVGLLEGWPDPAHTSLFVELVAFGVDESRALELRALVESDSTELRALGLALARDLDTLPEGLRPSVERSLDHSNAKVAALAQDVLGLRPTARPSEPLETLLARTRVSVFDERAEALAELVSSYPERVETAKTLVLALDTPSLARTAAQLLLSGSKSSAARIVAVKALRAGIMRHDSPATRSWIAWILGRIGSVARPALPELIALLDSTDWVTRANAVQAIGRIARGDANTRAKAEPRVLALLEDPEPEVRRYAELSLARLRSPGGSVERLPGWIDLDATDFCGNVVYDSAWSLHEAVCDRRRSEKRPSPWRF